MRHTKNFFQIPGELPWEVQCICGWKATGKTKSASGALHKEHCKATASWYLLWQPFAGGALYVYQAAKGPVGWLYTPDREQALIADHKTRTRFFRAMKLRGKQGKDLPVPAPQNS